MDSAENQPNASPENQPENTPPNSTPENQPAPPENAAPVNSVAETITAAELLPKRGRGRPKGSKTKNRRADGKFAAAPSEPAPADPSAPAQFISEMPGEPSPAGAAAVAEGADTLPGTENGDPAPSAVDYHATAGLMVAMGTSSLAMIFGDEWQPENESERNGLIEAVAAYLKTTNVQEIPPSAMLLIAIAVYSAKRVNKPTTSGKLKLWWAWIKTKFSRRKKTPAPAPVLTANFQPAAGGVQ